MEPKAFRATKAFKVFRATMEQTVQRVTLATKALRAPQDLREQTVPTAPLVHKALRDRKVMSDPPELTELTELTAPRVIRVTPEIPD